MFLQTINRIFYNLNVCLYGNAFFFQYLQFMFKNLLKQNPIKYVSFCAGVNSRENYDGFAVFFLFFNNATSIYHPLLLLRGNYFLSSEMCQQLCDRTYATLFYYCKIISHSKVSHIVIFIPKFIVFGATPTHLKNTMFHRNAQNNKIKLIAAFYTQKKTR